MSMAMAMERAEARAEGGVVALLATLAGALVAVLAVGVSVVGAIDIFGRYVLARPLPPWLTEQVYDQAGIAFAAISLLALPAALTAGFARREEPPLRSHSALALVPGCIVAILAVVLGIALSLGVFGASRGASLVAAQLTGVFSSYTFLLIPLILTLGALLGGGRTPEATAAAAGPVALAVLLGLMGETSIAALLLGLLVPMVLLAMAWGLLFAAAPARAVAPWLAGPLLALAVLLPLVPGALTPTETAAAFVLLALIVVVPIRTIALGHPIGPMLRQLAMETAAIAAALLTASLLASVFAYLGLPVAIAEASAGSLAITAVGALVFLVLSYLLTPVAVFALTLPLVLPVLQSAGYDLVWTGAVMALLGLAAMTARAARRAPPGPASLPRFAAWMAAAVTLAMAVIVILAPQLALAPVGAIR
jgi:C4-dicarboxylate transporter DctM subunit